MAMSVEDKVRAYEMRLRGSTVQEIADEFGVTKQYIAQFLPKGSRTRKPKIYESCVFPAIRNYLFKNRYTYSGFAKKCCVSDSIMRNALDGNVVMSKTTIDRILEATGMTYEEAFTIK